VSDGVPGLLPDAFATAMDDDLGVPQALGVLHDAVRAGNAALDGGRPADGGAAARRGRGDDRVLGVNPLDPAGRSRGGAAEAALGTLVQRLIDDRDARTRRQGFRGCRPHPR
jgi:cysteinyl-tRNA synthetase